MLKIIIAVQSAVNKECNIILQYFFSLDFCQFLAYYGNTVKISLKHNGNIMKAP